VQAFVRGLPVERLKKYVANTKVVLDAQVEAVNAMVKRINKFWSTSKALQIKTDLLLSENKYNQLRNAMSYVTDSDTGKRRAATHEVGTGAHREHVKFPKMP
jgi:hypothetical protein